MEKNLIRPLLGNKAFHDGFYFTFYIPCLRSDLQDCFDLTLLLQKTSIVQLP